MIPGEIKVQEGNIPINVNRKVITLSVANTGDRPIQVGSHTHFAEVNKALFNADVIQFTEMALLADSSLTDAQIQSMDGDSL